MATQERWPWRRLRLGAGARHQSESTQSYSQVYARRAALALFLSYLAVFPGSTITVALDVVPVWGEWMGGALLLLQGAIVLCWLLASYGRRGAQSAMLVFLLAWGVEHLGATTGFPFGRYQYTAQLQPQLLGAVPLAIPCAWLMVAVGAWQLAALAPGLSIENREPPGRYPTENPEPPQASLVTRHSSLATFLAATLVLLLDLQIEPVATAINRYWAWLDGGAYYGVPAANFAAWWAVGLVMVAIVNWSLCRYGQRPTTNDQRPTHTMFSTRHLRFYVLRFTFYAIPSYLYLLNTLMFTAINLARGYAVAGVAGLVILVVVACITITVAIISKAFAAR